MESINTKIDDNYYKLITEDPNLGKLIDFFEEKVNFYEDNNPTGIYNSCRAWAMDHGSVINDGVKYYDKVTGEPHYNKKYIPDNPNLYKIIWVDHLGLLSPDKTAPDLRNAIQMLSATHFVKLRNHLGFTIWAVQQQMAFDTVDAFKIDKIEPSVTNLSDNKATAKDANAVIALWSPVFMGKDVMGFDNNLNISFRKLGIYGRIAKVLANRDGMCGESFPLFMDGAISWYSGINENTLEPAYQEAQRLTVNK